MFLLVNPLVRFVLRDVLLPLLVELLLLLGVVGPGLPLVPHVGDVSVWAGAVGDDLDAAVGEVDAVLAGRVVVVPVLAGGEDGAVVGAVVDAVLVVVDGGDREVVRLEVGGRGGVVGGGQGQHGRGEEDLESGFRIRA